MAARTTTAQSAKLGSAALLLFVLSACGFETSREPNLRVVGPPAIVRPASATPAITTTIKVDIGDALIISTRPTDKQLAPDPAAEVIPDPATVKPVAPVTTAPEETTTSADETTTTVEQPTTTIAATTTTVPVATVPETTTSSTTVVSTTVTPTTTTIVADTTTTSTAATTTTTTQPTSDTGIVQPANNELHQRRATDAFAVAQGAIKSCVIDPSACDHGQLQTSFAGTALVEVTSIVASLNRSNLYVSIAAGDGYVLESSAVNIDANRASLSGCFTSIRQTMDATGQLLTASFESTREAYEMTQVDGVWAVVTHRALGAC